MQGRSDTSSGASAPDPPPGKPGPVDGDAGRASPEHSVSTAWGTEPRCSTTRLVNDLACRLLAEFLGTAFLLVGVIGSGIMAERLTDDVGLQLLANAAATVGVLYVILMFGEVSGAHLNPAVTLADILLQKRPWVDLGPYVAAQLPAVPSA